MLTQKCICGTTVTAHVAENKRRRAWQKNYIFVISENIWIFVTFIQNHFRNICYLWYTTVTRTLRLFSDAQNFLKFMQLLRIIFNPHWGIWHLLEFLTPVHEVFKLHNWCAFWTSHVVIESVTENWKTCSTCMFIITCKLLSATSSCTVDMFLMILLFFFIMASHVPFG